MYTKSYLTFSLHDVQYGIDANVVREIFLLPELTSIAEVPIDIVGILNLRRKILPVMHLDLRLGNTLQECHLSDSVIVVEWEGLQIGMIVNAVHEVKNIENELIETEIEYGRVREINPAFVAGVAKVDADMILLLNPEALIRQPDAVEALIEEATSEVTNEKDTYVDFAEGNGKAREIENALPENNQGQEAARIISSFYDLCCPKATPEERAIFRRRADNLRQATTESSDVIGVTGQIPLAVIGLNGEYFAIDLDVVREFTHIRNLTQIPCCPNHIVGNMNLRGEIVTLVDIRTALNLSMAPVKTGSKAVVIEVDDVVAGLPVDEVFDVMYLYPSDVNSVPASVSSNSEESFRGTAPYFEKMLSIIDLPKIIKQGGLTVNEEV